MKNYLKYTFWVTLLTVLLLLALHVVPVSVTNALGLRRINLLSDLGVGLTTPLDEVQELPGEVGAGEYTEPQPEEDSTPVSIENTDPATDPFQTQDPAEGATAERADSLRPVDSVAIAAQPRRPATTPAESPVFENGVARIEDYSPGGAMLGAFRRNLTYASLRNVRIAYMGDSFIEGDLLTGDLREQFQNAYGGGGVGFVPITSQVAGFRQTVGHRFGNWRTVSIANSSRGLFPISGFSYTPYEGSYVEYKGSSHKQHLASWNRARFVYTATGPTTITALVNGNKDNLREFTADSAAGMQAFVLEGESMQSIRYTLGNVEGFTAYGAFLDNAAGVCVDNFSIRGNTGVPMARINCPLTEQFDRLSGGYSLIILQYGLNMVTSQRTNYTDYERDMTTVVQRLKACFPSAAILIVSVGDRSTRNEAGNFVSMPGVRAMVATLQRVARDNGVLFWNAYQTMVSMGGMPAFVRNGWAAKDYTHIGARGGQKIAAALYQALTQ